MRDIKFKAWCISEKAFIAGFNMVGFHSYFTKGLEPSIYRYGTQWKLSEIILCQYTGFKDKVGREIYEGDIIETWYSRDMSGLDIVKTIYAVEYEVGNGKSGFDELIFLDNAVVIGNIYQHPELLNSDKNDETSVATDAK